MKLPFDTKSDGFRPMVIGFLTIGGLMTAHTILETARDTLFLTKLPATAIPWNYLAIAFIAYFVAHANAMLGRKFEHRKLLSISAVAMSGITGGLWFLFEDPSAWMFYALYIWTGLVATVLIVQFWVLMGSIVTVTQAKKIFGMVTAGGLVGAISGSLIALQLLDYFKPRDLLLASAITLLTTSFYPMFFSKRNSSSKSISKSVRNEQFERSRPYLIRLVTLVFLSTVAFTVADFLLKMVLANNYQGNELGQVLARFYLVVNTIALVSQIFLTQRIMSKAGANFSIVVLPALMMLGAIGVAFGPQMIATAAIASLLFLKGSEGALKHSLHRTALEVLYFPLPKDVRDRFKAIIDVVGQRGGQAIASLALLFAFNFLSPTIWHLAVVILIFLVGWIVVAIEMRRHYVDLFRGNLRELGINKDRELAELDLVGLQTLLGALNSEKDGEVLSALDIFITYESTDLLPVLILYHPSKDVVLKAFQAFVKTGRTDFLAVAHRLLEVDDDEIRVAALRNIGIIEHDPVLLQKYIYDPSPALSSTAIVGMIGNGWGSQRELYARLSAASSVEEPERRLALLKAIQLQPHPVFNEVVLSMIDAPKTEVLLEIAITMGYLASPDFIPPLINFLSEADLRPAAREALVKIGDPALEAVDKALSEHLLPHKIRRHLPRTISKFEPGQASEILIMQIENHTDDIILYKILRGLGRIISDNPDLPFDRTTVEGSVKSVIGEALNRLDSVVQISDYHTTNPDFETTASTMLIALLQEKEKRAHENIFRIFAMLDSKEDFQLLFDSLKRGSSARAGSTEILERSIPPKYRGVVFALLSSASEFDRRREAFEKYNLKIEPRSYQENIRRLFEDPNIAVRALAAYHASELGFIELLPLLKEISAEHKAKNLRGLDVEAINDAIASLTQDRE